MEFVWILVGLVGLVVGAEGLVRGGSGLAARLGVPPIVIGLTVVAFGTSAPELAVSLRAAVAGQSDVAVANVVGSNIFNIFGILGVAALIVPLGVASRLVRVDVPLAIVASAALLLFALDGRLGRVEGGLFCATFAVYAIWLVKATRDDPAVPAPAAHPGGIVPNAALVVVGLAALIAGAGWFVDGATAVARRVGISDHIVGLTVVAVGTSLPEAATSVIASLRGQRDIAVGNVVGSNIFNILVVAGIPAVVSREGLSILPQAVAFDIPIALVAAACCLPVLFTGYRIERWEGGLFLAAYVAYTVVLVRAGETTLTAASAAWIAVPVLGIVSLHAVIDRLQARRAAPSSTGDNDA